MRETATSSFPHTVSPMAATCLFPCVRQLALYSFLVSVWKHTTSSAVHSTFPLPVHTILPHSAPFALLLFLPPLKVHALLSALSVWSGQREQNNGCLWVSPPSIGGTLAASMFLFDCQYKRANAANLLLAHLATTVDWTKWKRLGLIVCLCLCQWENIAAKGPFQRGVHILNKTRGSISPFTHWNNVP